MDIICLYLRVLGNGLIGVCNVYEWVGMKLVVYGVIVG